MVESLDHKAVVDFLSEGVTVEITIERGKIYLHSAIYREGASQWIQYDDEHDVPPIDERL
jgi:hypothetical protein